MEPTDLSLKIRDRSTPGQDSPAQRAQLYLRRIKENVK